MKNLGKMRSDETSSTDLPQNIEKMPIFWPESRCLPVEEVSDLLGRKLEQATPNEAGKLIREDEKPLLITAWGDVTPSFVAEYGNGLF